MANRFKNDTTLPTVEEIKWDLIQEALLRCDGNTAQAAKMIGLSYRTLLREMVNRGEATQHIKSRSVAQDALNKTKGNATAASRLLGKNPTYVSRLISRGRVTRP